MIQLRNFSKSYSGHTVLALDQFKIQTGLHLIQGPNGSGKTTFFKSIAGIIKFNGDCFLDGLNIKQVPVEYRRHINYCEAEPNFPSFLSGYELIDFVSQAKKTPRDALAKITEAFKLEKFWEKPTSTYSSGMLKKVSLAMGFAGNPKAILLDEPFTTIDQESKSILCQLIKEYKDKGCTFLISAHQEVKTIPLKFESHLILGNQTVTRI